MLRWNILFLQESRQFIESIRGAQGFGAKISKQDQNGPNPVRLIPIFVILAAATGFINHSINDITHALDAIFFVEG